MMKTTNLRVPLRRSRQVGYRFIVTSAMLVFLHHGCKSNESGNHSTDPEQSSESACPWDDDNTVKTATNAELGAETSGYLCPLEDVDYYAFSVPSGQTLLKVDIELEGFDPAVNPTYVILSSDGETVIGQPDGTESAGMNRPLSIVHKLDPGDYLIQIHDESKDAIDRSHPYLLTLTGMADPDKNEPNDDADTASSASGEVTGYLSFRGDEDWYLLDTSSNGILDITLSMVDDSAAPAYRIEDQDGNEIVRRENGDGVSEVQYFEALPGTGTYYLVVFSRDELSHDPETAYTLDIQVISDPDTHEPNDSADTATPLSGTAVTCTASWTTLTFNGYIGSSGDTDWYRINLASCGNSVIDVDVTFDNPGTLPDDLQAAVRLIRPSTNTTCTTDQECSQLSNRRCYGDIDCTRFGNSCLKPQGAPEDERGYCAGASVCLPEGVCGAPYISRNSAQLETSDPDYDPGAPATPNKVSVGAPLFGIDPFYIVVEDYKGDSFSVNNEYTLTVRVAKDTDRNEPSEVYLNAPPLQEDSVEPHLENAVAVPVVDCTGSPSTCCSNDADWTTGAISYTFDQDWYQYEHPCPDEDCMVRIYYRIDSGPTDVLMSIYLGGWVWYDTVVPVSDTGNQSVKDDVCGDNECMYAYRDHSGYYFNVRDTIFVSEGSQNDGTWDWDKDQMYRFCIAKYADGCSAPCNNDPDYGCGFPQ